MYTEIQARLALPDRQTAERILSDELLAEFIRDDCRVRGSRCVFLDTPDWELYERSYFLRIRDAGGRRVAALKSGRVDAQLHPGLYTGRQWLCLAPENSDLAAGMIEAGAPEEVAAVLRRGGLTECFRSETERTCTVLWLPKGVRIELAVDMGTLTAGEKSEPLRELSLELLFGDLDSLYDLCEKLAGMYALKPVLSTKQERALRLLRSR